MIYIITKDPIQSQDPIQSSTIIKLETLRAEYGVLLAQYQQAQKTYINNLRKPQDIVQYTTLPGRAWWGTGNLEQGQVNSEKECQNMCVSNGTCSGATFNPSAKYCWTRSGNGPLSPGDVPSGSLSAILPTLKANNIALQSLNGQLVKKTTEINTLISNSSIELEELDSDKSSQQYELNITYENLSAEKIRLMAEAEEYNTITQTNNDYTMELNQEYVSFNLWTILAAIILIILFTQTFGFGSSSKLIILLFIIVGIMLLTYSLKTPTGFAVFGLVIISIIYIKAQ